MTTYRLAKDTVFVGSIGARLRAQSSGSMEDEEGMCIGVKRCRYTRIRKKGEEDGDPVSENVQ
jgi:hypothetical protein